MVAEASGDAASRRVSRNDKLVLGAILVFALALRLLRLESCLWYDEVDTLVSHTRESFLHLLTHFPSLNDHVFFTLQAKAVISLIGESAFAVRLPAALFGVASIAALWLLAREVTTRTAAHLSALLMTLAYHHVWFSQNARGYTGLLFWGLLALLFYVRGMAAPTAREWRTNALGLAVSSGLMLYTHASGAFLLLTLGLVHLGSLVAAFRQPAGTLRARAWWPIVGLLGGGLLAVLLLSPMIPDMLHAFGRTSSTTKGTGVKAQAIAHWNSPLWMLKEVVAGFSKGSLLAALVVVSVVGAGMWNVKRRGNTSLPLTFLVHVPLTILLLKLASMRVWPRFFFQDIGFICLFLVEGAMFFGRWAERLGRRFLRRAPDAEQLGAAFALLGVLGATAMLPRNYRHPKQDLLGARQFVEQNRATDAVVVALGLASLPYRQYYAPSWGKLETLEELLALEKQHDEVWVVYTSPDVTEGRYPSVVARLDYAFKKAAELPGTLGDGDMLVYRSKYTEASLEVRALAPNLSLIATRGLIGGNTVVYADGSDVLVVDSNAQPLERKLARALQQVTPKPPRWVINTHWHLDHAGGNAALAAAGARVIAHPNAKRRLEEDLEKREEPLDGRLPTELVDDRRTLTLAAEASRIVHLPLAHTDGDLLVQFVKANVIQTGDLFVNGSFPYISGGSGGSIDGYIAAQEKLLGLCDEHTRLVPGHGEPAGRVELETTLAMLKTARERVAKLKQQGQSLEQVTKADPLADMQAKWGQTWITSPLMAKFIYTTLGTN